MTTDERLAQVYDWISSSGIQALVMGGHAVRFYGVERTTVDYDLHLLYADWGKLGEKLHQLFAFHGQHLVEAPTWRPAAFRRFVIGRLPDGREERLECWKENHLLPVFAELFQRRCEGAYGGETVAFLGIADLIWSKETEREDDWRDIELLEEIQDERLHAKATDFAGKVALLSRLRSRRGFARAVQCAFLSDARLAAAARRRGTRLTRSFRCGSAASSQHPRGTWR